MLGNVAFWICSLVCFGTVAAKPMVYYSPTAVGVYQWQDSALEILVGMDKPVKVIDAPLSHWRTQRWSKDYLTEAIPSLVNVKQMPPATDELFVTGQSQY